MYRKFFIFIIFLLSCVVLVLLSDAHGETRMFNIKFYGGISTDFEFTSNHSLGFWGFTDETVDKQYFSGYLFGMVLGKRVTKNLELFLDFTLTKSSLLMGNKDQHFKGPAVSDADPNPNYSSNISPKLPADIYYTSKATMGRVGAKFVYSVDKIFEPYVGITFGIVPYEIAFSNKDGSTAYSEILYGVQQIYSIILGVDFNFLQAGIKILSGGLFFEYGAAVTDAGTTMRDWIWHKWTYHAQFPIVPAYRFGVSLGF